jgi:methyl-accepting chemotaxis protein
MKLRWKDIKLGRKFAVSFGAVLSLLSVVALWSIVGIGGIVDDASEVISGNELIGMLAQREVDHLNWANNVNALITDDKVHELSIETDAHKCGFGKWLYGDGRKAAEALVPSLAPLFKKIEEPHLKLHQSAIAIGHHYKAADAHLPDILLKCEIEHLKWAAKIKDAFLKNQGHLHVETDPDLCTLGKWLSSDNAQAIYDRGDAEFKAVWNNMVQSNEELHSSAKDIQKQLAVDPDQARQTFERTTRPLLDRTIAGLNALHDMAMVDIDGQIKASDVYAHQTQPALHAVQDLLHQIKEEAKKNIMTDEQMLGSALRTRKGVVIFSAIAIILGSFLAFVLARGIIGPLKKGVRLAEGISKGDLTETVDMDQDDEIGVLARALGSMANNLKKLLGDISGGVETLTSSSTELSAISLQMSSGAEQSSNKSTNVASAVEEMSTSMNSVAAAAEQASQNVNMVAAAAEEMSSTIDEIARNTEKGRTISLDAVNQAAGASKRMEDLGSAAREVGTVTETITDISEQTNLLALNATIEAARAGEAGKGFAVVANEIKELAKQTAEATGQIRDRIGSIQNSTSSTVTEIQQVTAVINEVNEIVSTIASAIEEQSIATKEITNNVTQASSGIQEVAENVAQSSAVSYEISKDVVEVKNAAEDNASASSQVHLSSEELSGLSDKLKEMVGRFKLQ